MLRTSAWAASSALAIAAALAACAVDNGLVGGECAPGYVRCDHACCVAPPEGGVLPASGDSGVDPSDALAPIPDGSRRDGASQSDSGSEGADGGGADGAVDPDAGASDGGVDPDAGSDGGGGCVSPLVLCGNQCVDTDSDPQNCGSCGKVCPSNACAFGLCTGTAAGHVIAIGHDYQNAPSQGSSQARVVSNATLLPLSNPLRVLSYERYASNKATGNVKAIVQNAAQLLGRKVTFTSVVLDAAVPAMLDINAFDVLLVPDQPAAATGALATLGSGWKQTSKIDAFLHGGGVVLVLDGGTGIDEMPAFLTGAGLLATNTDAPASGALTVTAPNDAVGVGVISPYVPTLNTVSFDTELASNTVTYVVSKQAAPIVVHKVIP